MSTTAVKQSLAFYANAIDAVDLSKRATLATARSWSEVAEATFPAGRPGPWTLVDAGLESAESFVTAQTSYAKGLLDATASALGVSFTAAAPAVVPAKAVATTVEPAAKTAAARAPKPTKPAGPVAPKAARPGSSAKGASRRRPAAG